MGLDCNCIYIWYGLHERGCPLYKGKERFFLGSDDDGHWFLIPADMRDTWMEWRDLDSEDERSWDVPKGAIALNGHPTWVEFENPKGGF